jgi:2-C-methyl-D-erythritol 2,4-cyclodiphosphate synthase
VEGRDCILGGIVFPECDVGPEGHSDGDAVCHAICDALLGAANLGDIGRHFPDSDPKWAGAPSLEFLRRVGNMLQGAGYRVVNLDCTVIAEKPWITPRAPAMAATVASALTMEVRAVSIKATRAEGMGPEGRGDCLSVLAVALIEGDAPEA